MQHEIQVHKLRRTILCSPLQTVVDLNSGSRSPWERHRLSCWVLLAGHVFPEFDRELSLAEGVGSLCSLRPGAECEMY